MADAVKITLSKTTSDRLSMAAAALEKIADGCTRIAVALEKLAEYERQKSL